MSMTKMDFYHKMCGLTELDKSVSYVSTSLPATSVALVHVGWSLLLPRYVRHGAKEILLSRNGQ